MLKRLARVAAEEMSGLEVLMYMHLYDRFNRANWAGKLKVQDGELIATMRAYGRDGRPCGLQEMKSARKRLKKRGLIEYEAMSGSAVYKLSEAVGTEYAVSMNMRKSGKSLIEKPLTQLKEFFKRASELRLNGNEQLLYLLLFLRFNRSYWAAEITLTDTQLQEMMRTEDGKAVGLSTLRRARACLKEFGLIEYEASRFGTSYSLTVLKSGSVKKSEEVISVDRQKTSEKSAAKVTPEQIILHTPEQYPEHKLEQYPERKAEQYPERNGGGDNSRSNNRAREDCKDCKDSKDGTDINTTTAARARARSYCSAEVEQMWLDCRGERLKGGVAIGMIELENQFGTKAVVDAIIAADQYNSRDNLSFNLVKKILEGGKVRGRDNVNVGLTDWGANRKPPAVGYGRGA